MNVAETSEMAMYGSVLPRMTSIGRSGDTMICSIVPRSFSRTTVMDVAITPVSMMMKPISPGTRNRELTRSGLYQIRDRRSTGT